MNQAFKWIGITALCAGVALGGCSPVKEIRGNLIEDKNLTRIEPFITDKGQLRQMLGSPVATSMFDQDVWYYVGEKTEQTAFMRHEVAERRVIAVHFTPEGFVSEVEELDSTGYDVALVGRETPTSGHDITLMQQLLGNIGRFSGESDNPAMGGP